MDAPVVSSLMPLGKGWRGKEKIKLNWKQIFSAVGKCHTITPGTWNKFNMNAELTFPRVICSLTNSSCNNLTSTSCLLANTRMGTPSRASLVIIFSRKHRNKSREVQPVLDDKVVQMPDTDYLDTQMKQEAPSCITVSFDTTSQVYFLHRVFSRSNSKHYFDQRACY